MKLIVIENNNKSVSFIRPSEKAVDELGLNNIDELIEYLIEQAKQDGLNVVGVIAEEDLPKNYIEVPAGSPIGSPVGSPALSIQFKEDWILNNIPVKKTVSERYFRNAWVWDNTLNKVVVDPVKEKQIRSENARKIRNQLLEKSDLEIIIAYEKNDTVLVDSLKVYRQTLRDLGIAIDNDPENINWPVHP